ncbi:MAG: PD40 domain-containing protein, partial [Anaerolineae bacterium]|nr:PD40 domain-containing protein [Anaerolineae bacterium]
MNRRILFTIVLLIVTAVPIVLFFSLRGAPLQLASSEGTASESTAEPVNGDTIPQGNPPRDLLLATDQNGDWDIALLQSDGTLRNLTADDSGAQDVFASFAFNGETINFLANRINGDEMGPSQVDASGGDVRNLTIISAVITMFQEQQFDWDAAWSPDGETLLWASVRDLNLELYTIPMNADFSMSNATRITDSTARDWFHSWSPDGSQIVFNSDRNGNEDIFVYDLASQETRQLTSAEQDDIHGAWSRDGNQILFVSERETPVASGNLDLYIMNADGSEQQPFPEDQVFEG